MNKEPIKIETIEQLLEAVTPENVDRFFLDFCVFIHDAVKIRAKFPKIGVMSMTWIDDGIHEVTEWEFTDENDNTYAIIKQKKVEKTHECKPMEYEESGMRYFKCSICNANLTT